MVASYPSIELKGTRDHDNTAKHEPVSRGVLKVRFAVNRPQSVDETIEARRADTIKLIQYTRKVLSLSVACAAIGFPLNDL